MVGNCAGDYDRDEAPRMDPNSRTPKMSKTISKATEARVRALTNQVAIEAEDATVHPHGDIPCGGEPFGCDGPPAARDVISEEIETLNTPEEDPETAAATARDPPMRGASRAEMPRTLVSLI